MAFRQYFPRGGNSVPAAPADGEKTSGGFDCNICLDFAHEPVVTLCGHLYCWPCIYKWLHLQGASIDSDEHPQCPVCKAEISPTSVIPLYGRGQILSEVEQPGKAPSLGIAVPPRPPAFGTQALMNSSNSHQQFPHHNPRQHRATHEESSSPAPHNLGGSVFNSVVGMFGEMVYARVFGNSESLYAYPNSYDMVGSGSPVLRRQEMQANKSLNRISVFLFCCFLLCFIFF